MRTRGDKGIRQGPPGMGNPFLRAQEIAHWRRISDLSVSISFNLNNLMTPWFGLPMHEAWRVPSRGQRAAGTRSNFSVEETILDTNKKRVA